MIESNVDINFGLVEALNIAKTGSASVALDTITVTNTSKGVIEAYGVGAHVDVVDSTIIGGTLKTMGGTGVTAAAINVSGAFSTGAERAIRSTMPRAFTSAMVRRWS